VDPVTSKVLEKAGKAIIGEIVGPAAPVVGAGLFGIELLDYRGKQIEKEVLTKAQQILGCNHVVICEHGGHAAITDLIATVSEKKGVGFIFDGVALWHFDDRLDVSKLSNRTFRWDYSTGQVTSAHRALRKCSTCYPEENKMPTPKEQSQTPATKMYRAPVGLVR
jgi:hypothetical protein